MDSNSTHQKRVVQAFYGFALLLFGFISPFFPKYLFFLGNSGSAKRLPRFALFFALSRLG
jgi:hypothetical protein